MSTTLIIVASATPAGLLGALVALAPSLRIRRRADIELAAADAAVAKAEELYAEHERTRNLPWHYAVEAGELEEQPEPWIADEDAWAAAALQPVDAEVLHVEHATGELPVVTMPADQFDELAASLDEPDPAPNLTAAAALLDRPAEDEDEVGDEQPGEASTSALVRFFRRLFDAFDRALHPGPLLPSSLVEWFRDRFKSQNRLAREFLESDDEERRVEIEAWVNANPPTPRHWNDVTAVHEQVYVGRRRAAEIPAQRSGDADADA